MVQTFLFRTETTDNTYHHTVHAIDLNTALEKWIGQIEDLQNQVYSFDPCQTQNIKRQYADGRLQMYLDKSPYYLTYQNGDKRQVVHIDKVNKREPDFIARLTYLTTEQGGRKGYAASGYRPHIKFEGKEYLTSGEQLFVDKDKVLPGEAVTAEIRIISPEIFKNYLFVGQHFEVAEASHLVGHGEVLEVINTDLLQASR